MSIATLSAKRSKRAPSAEDEEDEDDDDEEGSKVEDGDYDDVRCFDEENDLQLHKLGGVNMTGSAAAAIAAAGSLPFNLQQSAIPQMSMTGGGGGPTSTGLLPSAGSLISASFLINAMGPTGAEIASAAAAASLLPNAPHPTLPPSSKNQLNQVRFCGGFTGVTRLPISEPDVETDEYLQHVVKVAMMPWPAAAGKRPPRDMKRLNPIHWYIICKVLKWGDTPALFMRGTLHPDTDFGFYKPPTRYYKFPFQVGDRLQVVEIGYSVSRNKIATDIRAKFTKMYPITEEKANWKAPMELELFSDIIREEKIPTSKKPKREAASVSVAAAAAAVAGISYKAGHAAAPRGGAAAAAAINLPYVNKVGGHSAGFMLGNFAAAPVPPPAKRKAKNNNTAPMMMHQPLPNMPLMNPSNMHISGGLNPAAHALMSLDSPRITMTGGGGGCNVGGGGGGKNPNSSPGLRLSLAKRGPDLATSLYNFRNNLSLGPVPGGQGNVLGGGNATPGSFFFSPNTPDMHTMHRAPSFGSGMFSMGGNMSMVDLFNGAPAGTMLNSSNLQNNLSQPSMHRIASAGNGFGSFSMSSPTNNGGLSFSFPSTGNMPTFGNMNDGNGSGGL